MKTRKSTIIDLHLTDSNNHHSQKKDLQPSLSNSSSPTLTSKSDVINYYHSNSTKFSNINLLSDDLDSSNWKTIAKLYGLDPSISPYLLIRQILLKIYQEQIKKVSPNDLLN